MKPKNGGNNLHFEKVLFVPAINNTGSVGQDPCARDRMSLSALLTGKVAPPIDSFARSE